jgi:nucleoid-associated protein YgaU
MATQNQQERLEAMKQKYASALRAIEQQGVRLQNIHIQDNKLFIRGIAPSQDAKNKVWDQIKMVDSNYSDLTADITVEQSAGAGGAAGGGMAAAGGSQRTYTVKSGDTLSKIAQQYYGNAQEYNKIFEANRDKLKDPNKIQPGQQLVIPE